MGPIPPFLSDSHPPLRAGLQVSGQDVVQHLAARHHQRVPGPGRVVDDGSWIDEPLDANASDRLLDPSALGEDACARPRFARAG